MKVTSEGMSQGGVAVNDKSDPGSVLIRCCGVVARQTKTIDRTKQWRRGQRGVEFKKEYEVQGDMLGIPRMLLHFHNLGAADFGREIGESTMNKTSRPRVSGVYRNEARREGGEW